ncbi:vWA domain-containing protein [Methanovulcanius yangii]|uniref:Ig-like domain-containing protein n=1 Tax=Methanovulcanius yangii TaxID=1789227 RepID=UPI0029CAA1B3|nr:hypothetical protein [Methanovulcanius yangii]
MHRSCWRAGGALLVLLCVVASGAAALTEDEISILPESATITAGDEGVLIQATVTNATVNVERVTFTYLGQTEDPSGHLSVTSTTTATYQTVFTSTHAGDATIAVTVEYSAGAQHDALTRTSTVRVIPSDPYAYASPISFAAGIQAASTTPITVVMKDVYGNTINDETGATVEFQVAAEGAGFVDGGATVDYITVPFGADGKCVATFQAPETAGSVTVRVDPGIGSTLQKFITLTIIGEKNPAAITPYIVTVPSYPVPYECLADGSSFFDIRYLVTDRFGNPIGNYKVVATTTLNETTTIVTNINGLAHMTYGPKTGIGNTTLTATAGDVNTSQLLTFIGGEGASFAITVNPINLPSADVDPSATIAVQGRVFNLAGIGVAGETVSFWVTSGDTWSSSPMTADPALSLTGNSGWTQSAITATTDEDGIATVYFKGGTFPVHGEEDFDPFARGNTTVTVMWNDETQKSSVVTWRNYPYLRVETEVSDYAVAPGDELNVTIRLIGDGNELLHHLPIDVVLCLDRGEDMLLDEGKSNRDRMEAAREAAMFLVGGSANEEIGFTPGLDRVALLSYSDMTTDTSVFPSGTADLLDLPITFNWKKNVGKDGNGNDDEDYTDAHYPGNGITVYDDFSTLDYGFTYTPETNWNGLHNALWNTVPVKKDDSGQASAPLRLGLKESIQYLENNATASSVRAIVVLMQNNYRYFGDPFAEGAVMTVDPDDNTLSPGSVNYYEFADLSEENQNMVNYALANDIQIFTIYYPQSSSSDYLVPQRLAEETGGQFYYAGDEEQLKLAFQKIRDELLREAGVSTVVDLSFAGELSEGVDYTASELLAYVPPTTIDFYNWSTDPHIVTDHLPGYALDIDQMEMWTGEDGSAPASLHFDVGNITIKQTWETQFTLRINDSVIKPLNFSLFAEPSSVSFQNQEGSFTVEQLPKTIISVIPGLTPEGLINATVAVTDFTVIGQDPSFLDFGWNIVYNGDYDMDEIVYFRDTGDTNWKKIGTKMLPYDGDSDSLPMYIADLPPGEYEAWVRVSTEDAGFDDAYTTFTIGDPAAAPFILLT